jgi:beta-mannosidase
MSQRYFLKILLNNTELNQVEVKEKNVYKDIEIKNPLLWWPNGAGIPHIYDFVVILQTVEGVKVDERKIPFGIRTIELNQKDKQFQVKINGHSIYCKGANYVPMDMFYPRVEKG